MGLKDGCVSFCPDQKLTSIYLVNDFHKYHHSEWMTQLFLAFVVGDTLSLCLLGDLELEN